MKYILISSLLLMLSACSEIVYDALNYNSISNCRDNPNHTERGECETNKDRTFNEYEEEIRTNESKY